MKFLKEWGLFILIVAIMAVLRFFVFKPVLVDGHSMDPTLADRERLMMTLSTIKRLNSYCYKIETDIHTLFF